LTPRAWKLSATPPQGTWPDTGAGGGLHANVLENSTGQEKRQCHEERRNVRDKIGSKTVSDAKDRIAQAAMVSTLSR
jgi:hypothetical protein